MNEIATIPEGKALDFGPAMQVLQPKHRAFVEAYLVLDCDATKAARAVGYVDNGNGSIHVTAHRILMRPDILAAIREKTLAQIASDVPVYRKALDVIARTPHKDQVKAIGMLLNRGGLPEITEKHISVTVTLTRQEKEAEIRMMAETLGLDPKTLLGTVLDAEFEEVPEGMEGIW
jgi:hypothetical protein